jgi:hypothetical protein
MSNENTYLSIPTLFLQNPALRSYIDAIKARITAKRQNNDGINTPTLPPAAQHPLSTISNNTANEYLNSPQSSLPQKRHNDNEEQASSSKRLDTKDLPLTSNNDYTERPHSANLIDDEEQTPSSKRLDKNNLPLPSSNDYPESPHSTGFKDDEEETRPNKRGSKRDRSLNSNNDPHSAVVNDDEEEERPSKRRSTILAALRSSKDSPEHPHSASAIDNEEKKSKKRNKKPTKKTSKKTSKRDKKPTKKTSKGTGRGQKRQNESSDEGEDRRVRIRLTVEEEAAGPSNVSPPPPQEHDEENVQTLDPSKASTGRGVPTDEAIELYQEIKEVMAEKVGYLFLSFS